MQAAAHLQLTRMRFLPGDTFQSTVYVGRWMPALARESSEVVAYRVADEIGVHGASVRIARADGESHFENVPCSAGFMQLYNLLPLPFVCRRGVLVFVARDATTHHEVSSGMSADIVLHSANKEWADRGVGECVYAVVGTGSDGAWFNADLSYTLYRGGEPLFAVGVSELYESLVPYGSWLRVCFEGGFENNLQHNSPGAFLLPAVHACDWHAVGVWAALTYDHSGDARFAARGRGRGVGQLCPDSIFVVVDELCILGDLCDDRGRSVNAEATVEQRRVTWVVRAGSLRVPSEIHDADMRACYFV